jgi:hypothetical protein
LSVPGNKPSVVLKLVHLILTILFAVLAVYAVVSLIRQSYLAALFLAVAAAVLFASRRWSDYGKITLALVLVMVYLMAYLTNVVLLVTSKKGSDDLERSRLVAARQMGLPFDHRSPLKVVADLQAQGIDAVPMAYPFMLLGANGLPGNGGRLLPVTGISGKTTVWCNECGDYTIYRADRHGFNNPPGLWSQPVDIALIGDSFTQGACVAPEDNLAGRLRRAGKRVINLGVGGHGPLLETAVMEEYAAALKPKVVLWLYYEGNDLTDLPNEQKCPLLARYLDQGPHTQDLIHRQGDIDQAWGRYLGKVQERKVNPGKPWYYFPRLLGALRSFQLKELKSNLRRLSFLLNEQITQAQVKQFKRVLEHNRRTVEAWGGKLYLVYLPAFDRYGGQAGVYPLNQRAAVLAAVKNLGIPIIDFDPVISSQPDPLLLFPFRKNGHYNAKGYNLLTETVLAGLQ